MGQGWPPSGRLRQVLRKNGIYPAGAGEPFSRAENQYSL